MKNLKTFEELTNNNFNQSIIKKGIKYDLVFTSDDMKDFTYDWEDYCKEKPDTELVYEDEIGNTYVIYMKGNKIIGEFLNED